MLENKVIITIGAFAGSLSAIVGFLWFIGEPFLDRYVDSHIKEYEDRQKEETSKGVKLRELLGYKMGVDNDEVHVEIGRQYRQQKEYVNTMDSLLSEVAEISKFNKLVAKEFNYYHPDNLLKELE